MSERIQLHDETLSALREFRQEKMGLDNTKATSINTYENCLTRFFRETGKPVLEIVSDDIRDYMLGLIESKASRSYQRLTATALRGFFGIYSRNHKALNPATRLRSIRRENRFPDIPSTDEVERMILACGTGNKDQIRNAAIIALLADTGIRVGELVALKVGNVIQAEKQFILKVPSEKSTSQRQVPFSYMREGSLVAEIWNAYWSIIRFVEQRSFNDALFTQSEEYIKRFQKADWELINSQPMKGLSRKTIFTIVKKVAEMAEIDKPVSPHSFRHFYATYLAMAKTDIIIIKERLGHANISQTQIYIHYADTLTKDSAKDNPMAGIRTKITGFVEAGKQLRRNHVGKKREV